MNCRDRGENKFKRGGEFRLASDGGRSLPMEYDDVKFIDKDYQLAGKDEYESNTERHRQILPRFDLGDHIEVQLGFDSLEDSVLLEDQTRREVPWVSHFSREENGVLSLGTVPQNIEFNSTATETCTISRHINVWSEATSSESVQMLLNSVGEDEENLVDRQLEKSNLNESLYDSNSVEVNVLRIECSNKGEDLDHKQFKSTEIDQQGLNRAMEVKDDTQEILKSLESAEINRPKEDNFAYRDKEQGCILREEDAPKLHKDPKGEISCNESEQETATTASLQLAPSDSGVENQGMPNPVLEEYNQENTKQCEIEDIKEKDIAAVNLQGLVDEHNDTKRIRFITHKSDKAVVSSEDQVTSESPSNLSSLNKSIQNAIDNSNVDASLGNIVGKSALVTDNITDDMSLKHAIDTVAEDDTTVKTKSLLEPVQGVNDKAVNCGNNKRCLKENLGLAQDISDPMEEEINQDNTEKHTIACYDEKSKFDGEQGMGGTDNRSSEVNTTLLQGKSKDENIVEDDDASVKSDTFQHGDKRIEDHADVKTIQEQDHEQRQGISDPMEVDCIYDHKEQDAPGNSHENVSEEIQRNQDILLDKGNEHHREKHVAEASNEDDLPTYNDQKLECEGKLVITGSDGQSLETDTILEIKIDEQKDIGVETADLCLSGENRVIVSCNLLTGTHSEMGKDVGSSSMIEKIRSDCKIKESEVGVSSSIDESMIMPILNIKDRTQVVKCPVKASVSSPDCQNEDALSISSENIVHDGTNNLAKDVRNKHLLTGGFSTESDFHGIFDTGLKEENESKNTSVDSIVIATEKETMDAATYSLGRKSSPILNMEIQVDKHIAEVPSVQDLNEFEFPTEQGMIVTCEKPLQTNDSSLTQQADASVQSDTIEIGKGVEEADMLQGSKAQDDFKLETTTQTDCCSAQKEFTSIQESRLEESCTVQNFDASHVENVQKQQIKGGNTSVEIVLVARENEPREEATDSCEMKIIPGVPIVNDTKESMLPAEKVITSTHKESLQLNDDCTIPSVDQTIQTGQLNQMFGEGEKEIQLQIDSKVHHDKMMDPSSSSGELRCMPVSNTGDSCRQTPVSLYSSEDSERKDLKNVEKNDETVRAPINVPLQETMDSEKGKDIPETMEVSLEVGISLERHSHTSPGGDGNVLQAAAPNEIDVEVSKEPKEGLASSGKCLPDRLGTAKDSEVKPISQCNDTYKLKAGTKNVPSVVDMENSVDLTMSDEMGKYIGCSKPFQAAQPSEVKNNDSAVLQTGEVQDEACQESALSIMNSVQKGNIVSSEIKAKSVLSEEKTSQAILVKEIEKKPMSSEKKSVGNPVTSLPVESVSLGCQPSGVSTRQEPNTSSVGPPSSTQPALCSTGQTLNLPDLNATAAPASVLFQQPFSDSQQVQLRAQILVYGSLIQGALPEEALMLTAFADIGGASQSGTSVSDGARSLWENAWNTAADRIHQKTFSNASDVPNHASCSSTPPAVSGKIVEITKAPSPAIVSMTDSRNASVTGMRPVDLAPSRSHSTQGRAVGTTNAGRAANKNNPSSIMSPPRPVSLPSPVWGMTSPVNEGLQGSNIARSLHIDPHQMAATRHIYQSPQLGHYPSPGNSNPWLSPIHFPGTWLTPPQATLSESGLPFSSFVMPDMTQETLNNRRTPTSSSLPHTPLTHVIPHFPGMAVVSAGNISSGSTDASKGAVGRQSSSEQKSRKRKKKSVSEDIAQTSGLKSSVAQVSSVATNISKRPFVSTSTMSEMPLMTVTSSSNALIAQGNTMPNVPSASHYQVISRGEMGQRVIFSEETASRIEQAKLNAEEAASLAASALRHSQGIWSQLAAQKSSGLVSESEAKLASAAVAAAAAASVAKAAAAAAKVASDAAVQAKLMATEALNSDGKTDVGQSTEVRLLERNKSHSRSLISAARQTAKKRVEAASAATKRAENLDAVVRAAELAAQAVTQAGAVVAMGDPVPLTLNTLLEAGPEAYWKLMTAQQTSSKKDDHVLVETPSLEIANPTSDINIKHIKSKNRREVFAKDITKNVEEGLKNSSTEALKQLEKGCRLGSDFAVAAPVNIVSSEKDNIAQKENQVVGTFQTSMDAEAVSREEAAAPEPERNSEAHNNAVASKSNEIKEGSFVEVVSDEEGLRGVWFSAKVLSLKNGKAFVRYDELLSDEGPGQLQEWIPLNGENGKPPRIRMAHPMTVMKFEGTRKRRRAAMGGYVWSVGDHVDAWIRDGWWEGIIQEKDDDESKLKVHFPGEGDTSIIKAWNLRPSLIWRDGQWVEWTSLKAEKEGKHEDDIPSEKRQKLDKLDTEGDAMGKEKMQKIPNFEEAKKMQELQAVMSSGRDKSLSGAKNSTDDRSSVGIRVNQSSFQKEGSKVVFGVPKPTKKRKFMDVSKHYVGDRMARNTSDGKSLSKFDKHKVPLFQSQSGLKDTKAQDKRLKRPLIPKPKDLKPGKFQDGQIKTKIEKDKGSFANPTFGRETLGQEAGQSSMPTFGIDGSKGGRWVGIGVHVPTTKSVEASHLSVLKEAESQRPSSSNKVNASATESEQGSKGKQSSASDSSTINVEKTTSKQEAIKEKLLERATTDTVRRSNRRIQPTSRLLEGLQTSPTIMKGGFTISHSNDRGGKVQSKLSSSIPKGNING